MRKLLILVLFFISVMNLTIADTHTPDDLYEQGQDPTEIDYGDPASISEAPPALVDVNQALAQGNGAALTSAQWSHGNNLNNVGDLSLYPNAQQAVLQKHSSVNRMDLSLGKTSYENGFITNGGIVLNLNDPKLSGTTINSLAGGGFSIDSGVSQGEFTVGGNKFHLREAAGPVEIRENGEIFLPQGAKMVDNKGRTIVSKGTDTVVREEAGQLIVSGKVLINNGFGEVHVGIKSKSGRATIESNYCSKEKCYNTAISGRNLLWFPQSEDEQQVTFLTRGGNFKHQTDGRPIFFDSDMRDEVIKIYEDSDYSFFNVREKLSNYFPFDIADLLSSWSYNQVKPTEEIGGYRATLWFKQPGRLDLRFTGDLTSPVENDDTYDEINIFNPDLMPFYINTPFGTGGGLATGFKDQNGNDHKLGLTIPLPLGISPKEDLGQFVQLSHQIAIPGDPKGTTPPSWKVTGTLQFGTDKDIYEKMAFYVTLAGTWD